MTRVKITEAEYTGRRNKFNAQRTYSKLCGRMFDSKAEARRGEELFLLQREGEISGLTYQTRFDLYKKPKISYTADFEYLDKELNLIYEDVKGKLTDATQVKLAWVKKSME